MSQLKTANSGQRILTIVANIGPLLGFLGTVWGMVVSFEALAGLSDPQALPAGLSGALLTTGAGLIVALVVQAAHWHFNRFRS